MLAQQPIFGEHPSEALKAAYKGYQGCSPEDARVIILGKDPNYHRDIENWPVFPELENYLTQGVQFYVNNNGIVTFRHHPFLSNGYRNPVNHLRGDGFRYHNNFRRIFGECKKGQFINEQDYQDYISVSKRTSFVELVGIPTFGMVQGNDHHQRETGDVEFSRLLNSPVNRTHIELIKTILFKMPDKLVLVPKEVYGRLQAIFPDLRNNFPQNSYDIVELYNNNHGTSLMSMRHPSAALKMEYFPVIKQVITNL